MCFPGATAVMAIAQSVVSFAADSEDYNNRANQWRQNYTSSLAAGRDEQRQLSLRMIQEDVAFSDEQQQETIEGAQAVASAEASAASAGVSGISVYNIKAGLKQRIAARMANNKTNYQMRVSQLTEEMQGTNARIESRINSVQRPSSPNPLGYILQGIGGTMKDPLWDRPATT